MTTNEARKCAQCGYNLQGLPNGSNCPECGSSLTKIGTSVDTKEGSILRLINANLAVTGLAELPDLRVRMKYWMKLGAIFAFTVLILQLLVTFAIIPIGLYRLALGVLSIFWPTVVIGMMPSSADAAMPPMYTWIRKLAPTTQWCWPIGYVLWLMFHVPFEEYTLGGNLKHFPLILILHAVAGIGLAGIAFWIHDLALRLQLDCAAKRCNTFAIATVTLGLFVFVLPWKHFAAVNLGGISFLFAAYIFVLMGPWLWCVSLFARGLLEISNDAIWSLEYDDGLEGRQERINKKIKEHEHTRWL
ncbi:MAG: hypothetical protein HOH93_03885 [Phycisphaerae bacterium]|nr:hypothetical protein [Phycisphaerae bacterium]